MKTRAEKRTYERCGCTALIAFSYFNKKKCFNVKAINHSEGGMSFKSSFFLQPGATVYIREKKICRMVPAPLFARGYAQSPSQR
jgi:hypothetical protein